MLLLSRNYVFRVYPINRDYSRPSEQFVTCRLTCDYPTKEYTTICHSKYYINICMWNIKCYPQLGPRFKLTCFCFVRCSLRLWKSKFVIFCFILHFVAFFPFKGVFLLTYVQLDHPDRPLAFLTQTHRRTPPPKIPPRLTGSGTLLTCTASEDKFIFLLDESETISFVSTLASMAL